MGLDDYLSLLHQLLQPPSKISRLQCINSWCCLVGLIVLKQLICTVFQLAYFLGGLTSYDNELEFHFSWVSQKNNKVTSPKYNEIRANKVNSGLALQLDLFIAKLSSSFTRRTAVKLMQP